MKKDREACSVYGYGANGRAFVKKKCQEGVRVDHICDRNYEALGVESPAILKALAGKTKLFVTMARYDAKLNDWLRRCGYREGKDLFWLCRPSSFSWRGDSTYTDACGNIIQNKNNEILFSIQGNGNHVFVADGCHFEKGAKIKLLGNGNSVYVADDCAFGKDVAVIACGSDNRIFVASYSIGDGSMIHIDGDNNHVVIGKGSRIGARLQLTCTENSKVVLGGDQQIGDDTIVYAMKNSQLILDAGARLGNGGELKSFHESKNIIGRHLSIRGGITSKRRSIA